MANRLARERSPYLLQHANNPVDWYPWGDDAFGRARREDKPIFLSIGYSTCHWCHVMEHESFENTAVAAALNRDFVSIKVDREERPDIDRVYMTFVQATTGAGGWPMSVFLTPDLQPFFGGTYFPPESRWGRPGFVDLIAQLTQAWRKDRGQIVDSAKTVMRQLRDATSGEDSGAPDRAPVAGRSAVEAGMSAFAAAFDARLGGFGGAPKFPRPSELLFLLAAHGLTGSRDARRMPLDTLRAMALGGIRDHVGGGFHRYSVDAQWRVPHFEKMLYDQAQLVLAYLEAAQVSGEAFYASIAEDTLEYVLRDLTAPDGAFFSAEDADSEAPVAPAASASSSRGVAASGGGPGGGQEAPAAAAPTESSRRGTAASGGRAGGGQEAPAAAAPTKSSRRGVAASGGRAGGGQEAPAAAAPSASSRRGAAASGGRAGGGQEAPAAAAPSASSSRGAAASGGGAPRAINIDDSVSDRPHEKREGAFYVFSASEIDALFGADASIVRRRFGIEDGGNAPADPQGEFTGQNILYVAQSVADVAARSGRTEDEVMAALVRARHGLFDARNHRRRPHRDDKVITAWNGLMIAAYARAARVLVDSPRRSEWRDVAEGAAVSVRTHLWRAGEQRLLRRYREGEAAIGGFCEDYAYLAWGVIELFQATGDAKWLDWAMDITEAQTALFWDAKVGAWYSTTGEDPSVLLRLKEDYDGAEPAAASVTVRNLLMLGHLVSDPSLVDRAKRTLERYGTEIGRVARVMPLMLANVALWHLPSAQVVILGPRESEATRALEAVVARVYLPGAVQISIEPGALAALATRLPWSSAMTMREGRPTAYVCRDFACQEPVTDPAALAKQLEGLSTPSGRVILA